MKEKRRYFENWRKEPLCEYLVRFVARVAREASIKYISVHRGYDAQSRDSSALLLLKTL